MKKKQTQISQTGLFIIIGLIFIFRLIGLPSYQAIFTETIITFFLIMLTKLIYSSSESILFLLTTPFFFFPHRWEQKVIFLIFFLLFYLLKSSNNKINGIIFLSLTIAVFLYLKKPIITFQNQLEVLNGINHLRGNNISVFGPFISRFLFNKINLLVSVYKYALGAINPTLWFNSFKDINQMSPFSFIHIPLFIGCLVLNIKKNNLRLFFILGLILLALSGPITTPSQLIFLLLPVFNQLLLSFKNLSLSKKYIYLLANLCFCLFTFIYLT